MLHRKRPGEGPQQLERAARSPGSSSWGVEGSDGRGGFRGAFVNEGVNGTGVTLDIRSAGDDLS